MFDNFPVSLRAGYYGFGDGMAEIASGPYAGDWRLADSNAGMVYQGSGERYRFSLYLVGYPEPFAAIEGQQIADLPNFGVDIETANGRIATDVTQDGTRYQLSGRLGGPLGINAYVAFIVTTADGSVYYGAAAMDGLQI